MIRAILLLAAVAAFSQPASEAAYPKPRPQDLAVPFTGKGVSADWLTTTGSSGGSSRANRPRADRSQRDGRRASRSDHPATPSIGQAQSRSRAAESSYG